MFAASGTMTNLIGLAAHCRRGDEIIIGAYIYIQTTTKDYLLDIDSKFPPRSSIVNLTHHETNYMKLQAISTTF